MIAEASSAMAQPDPAKSPATVAHPPRQHQRAETTCGHGPPTRTPTDPVRDAPVVADLLTRAGNGDKQAWDALVVRYAPLIWSICRRYRLGDTDTDDVGQSVWLRLVDHLHRIREPAALPGWLATVTRRECLRVLRERAPMASYVLDAETVPDERAGTAEQELLAAERHAALREAFGDLPPRGQRLILLLIQDPPVPYAEISARLGIAVGSIGPNRLRYIDQLRRHPAITALINTSSDAP
jgi:RNA polymerase sigma factor (sigma-70 family)